MLSYFEIFLHIGDTKLKKFSWLSINRYSPAIYDFLSVWFELIDEFDDISTTPKTHILLDPLEDDFNLIITTLMKDIYELYENMHQFLNKILMKSFYFVKDISNPSHGSWGLLDTSTTYR